MKKNYLFILALILALSLAACDRATETPTATFTPDAGESATDTPDVETDDPTATATGEGETDDPTATAENNATIEPTATEAGYPVPFTVIALKLCETQAEDMCLLSLFPTNNNNSLAINLISNLENSGENYYLRFENSDYLCTLIPGTGNQFLCPDLPVLLDRTVTIQVYQDPDYTILLAEGQFFFSSDVIIGGPTPTTAPTKMPTQKPTPPDPYNP